MRSKRRQTITGVGSAGHRTERSKVTLLSGRSGLASRQIIRIHRAILVYVAVIVVLVTALDEAPCLLWTTCGSSYRRGHAKVIRKLLLTQRSLLRAEA